MCSSSRLLPPSEQQSLLAGGLGPASVQDPDQGVGLGDSAHRPEPGSSTASPPTPAALGACTWYLGATAYEESLSLSSPTGESLDPHRGDVPSLLGVPPVRPVHGSEPGARPAARARAVAYIGAAEGNDVQSGVLAAASDPRVAPVLERVTRTRLAFLERQFEALGLDPPAARARARMGYALYVGLGDLRRATPQAPMTESAVASLVEFVVDALRSRLEDASWASPCSTM